MEQVRQINCSNIECDNWEEFSADMPRDQSLNFEYLEDTKDNNAIYGCIICGAVTESIIENQE